MFQGGNYEELRKELIEDDLIELVISLPPGLLKHTGIPVSIIILNKDKKNKGTVKFIDAKDAFITTHKNERILDQTFLDQATYNGVNTATNKNIPISEIIANEYNLNPTRYFHQWAGRQLREFLQPINGKPALEDVTGVVVKTADLNNDKLNFDLILPQWPIPRYKKNTSH